MSPRVEEVSQPMLPIDPLLPELVAQLREQRRIVVEAAPGAGKTTRIPRAIMEAWASDPRQVVVSEPRRLAARLAASFVARELGCPLGDRVGYSVRFEDRTGPKTRLCYLTEGVLLQRLIGDPELSRVHTVVLDEFHERHLASDQLLALLARLCERRSDLKLVVMSATLDAEPLVRWLGDCPRVSSHGQSFDVRVEHDPEPDDRPLEKRVASAVRELVKREPRGHVLVFLPGAREIQRTQELLGKAGDDWTLHTLHGEMDIAAQAAAVAPSERRKVILATNVAESSVTVDGVTLVVDSGLARVAGYSPWSGRATLELQPISRASAIQRAGRAGRTAPGRVRRLYEEADFRRRAAHTPPEITRLDLTELVLQLAGMGLRPSELRWLDPLPEPALDAARALLERLGAIDPSGLITPTGQRMLRFPLAPRLARVLVAAEAAGLADEGALLVALLSERDIRRPPREGRWDLPTGLSDLEERMDAYREAEIDEFRPHVLRTAELDVARVHAVRRATQQLSRLARSAPNAAPLPDEAAVRSALRRCLLRGFSDRVALHQARGQRLISKNGTQAMVSDRSVVREAPLVLALEVEEQTDWRGKSARVQFLSAIDPEWLLEDYGDELLTNDELRFDAQRGRVESIGRLSYGSVTLEESRLPAPPSAEASAVLYEAARQQKATLVGKRSGVEPLLRRLELLNEHAVSRDALDLDRFDPDALLRAACDGITSLSELEHIDLAELVSRALTHEQRRLLHDEAPTHLTLAGRRIPIEYEPGKPPWVASRLQDFFGMRQGPSICRGRLQLTLHLLAPNRRAVQVTSDLASFWQRHYPELRGPLRARYPRHAWPEDGGTASPPPPRPLSRR